MRRSLALAACALLLPMASAAEELSETPDWDDVAEVETVQIHTENTEGVRFDTTVWLAVVDGQGYIRTGNSGWGDNVVRDPELELEIEGTLYPMRVYFVEDDALRQAISDSFREKYGFVDSMIGLFRGGRPKIMRLSGR